MCGESGVFFRNGRIPCVHRCKANGSSPARMSPTQSPGQSSYLINATLSCGATNNSWGDWNRKLRSPGPVGKVPVDPGRSPHQPSRDHRPIPAREPICRQRIARCGACSRTSPPRGGAQRRALRELRMMRWGMPPPPRAGGFPVTKGPRYLFPALACVA